MGHCHFFQMNFETELSKFRGHIVDGSLRLRRAARSWANILCEMRQPLIGVVIGQGGGLDRIQIVYQLRRKIVMLLGGVLRGSSPWSWRLGWFLSLPARCGEENNSETGRKKGAEGEVGLDHDLRLV